MLNQEIIIGRHKIGIGHEPFIIAEMSGNHNQSLEKALAIVKAAADAGAQALKLQTYTADTITIDAKGGSFDINDDKSLWKGYNLYQLYKQAYTPWEWHKTIFEYAEKLGIICFSSPFDVTSVDFLEELKVPAYKIASFENNFHDLLKKIAKTGKPVIMSTGVSRLQDIAESVDVLKSNGCKKLVLLKCTSTYPASPEDTNLLTIPNMRDVFQCPIGLSDHTKGIGVAVASVALGASVVEKHFTLDRSEGGVDSAFSIEPGELKSLVEESKRAFLALGSVSYGITNAEKNSLKYKRSVYAVEDIEAGEELTRSNVRVIRPGDGLLPKFIDIVIGKKAKSKIIAGTPINWELI